MLQYPNTILESKRRPLISKDDGWENCPTPVWLAYLVVTALSMHAFFLGCATGLLELIYAVDAHAFYELGFHRVSWADYVWFFFWGVWIWPIAMLCEWVVIAILLLTLLGIGVYRATTGGVSWTTDTLPAMASGCWDWNIENWRAIVFLVGVVVIVYAEGFHGKDKVDAD